MRQTVRCAIVSSLVLSCAAAQGREPPAFAPGDAVGDEHGPPVWRLLRNATRVLRLRRTTLRECAPLYAVDAPEGLEWADAVAYADGRFGADKIRRALFLRRRYARGQPAADLRELGLLPTGGIFSTGSARSWALVVVEGERGPGEAPGGLREALVTIGVCASHGERVGADATGERMIDYRKSVLLAAPTLTIRNVKVGDIAFDGLTFDARDKLVDFTFSTGTGDAPEPNASFLIGGNTTGEDGSDFYWAYVRDVAGDVMEIREYDEDLLVTRRSVMKPGSTETVCADVYVGGVPLERVFYEYRNGAGEIVRRVRFPLPEPSVDDAALERAFALLKSDDPRARRRARHALILAGPAATASIRARIAEASEREVAEFVKVLEKVGSPDAIDALVDLLGHDSDAAPGWACDALIRTGGASKAAVIRAMESPGSSDRAKRCCSYVLSALARRKAER